MSGRMSIRGYEPLVDVQGRNLAEAQADISIRGGIFENTGFNLGAVTISDPQTGHYLAEIPLAPAMLGAPAVVTGADQGEVVSVPRWMRPRSTRRAPESASSSLRVLVTAGWLRCSRSAARRRLRSCAMATKQLRWRKRMREGRSPGRAGLSITCGYRFFD